MTHLCDCCEAPTTNPEDYCGEFVCDDCLSSREERAYERFCSDFYGGEVVTLREIQIEALKLK